MAETLLELISTVTMPARLEKFVAKNHFIVDTSRKAKVKIDYLGDNFRNNFLNKIEEAISEIEFRYQKLKNIPETSRLSTSSAATRKQKPCFQ